MKGTSASLATIVESNSIDEIKAKVSNGEIERKMMKFSENNLDPLEYFARFLDIPEMILQHLNSKDLIKVSEVSPSYYNFIASSKVVMEKIKIFFKLGCNLEQEYYDLLKNSSRQYQSILFQRSDLDIIPTAELSFFQERARDWRNVSLSEIRFRKKLDLWKFLSSIELSVESLSVFSQMSYRSCPFDDLSSDFKSFKVLKFPKLKELKLGLYDHDRNNEAYTRFLMNSIAIKELDLSSNSLVRDGVLTKILENFDKLTSLKLRSEKINDMFGDESWKRFKFKLKSLTIYFQGFDGNINFWDFLKSQSQLEELNINGRYKRELFDVIMKMPKLRSLNLQYCYGLSEIEVRDKVSTSITDLKVDCFIDSDDLRFVLCSMPKVKRLSIFKFNQQKFQTLLAMGRKFEELRYCELSGIDPEALTEISDKVSSHPNYSFYLRNF